MADKSDEIKSQEIFIGLSSCLLGHKVRYDGDHRLNQDLIEQLGRYFTFLPVCPEIEVGMGVPRETVQLEDPENTPTSPRMIGTDSGKDWTVRMNRFSDQRVRQKDFQNLSGFILKARSPSCGMEHVKLYDPLGRIQKTGTGLFAAALRRQYPNLPIEDEDQLANHDLREQFIKQVIAYQKLKSGNKKKEKED